MLFDLKRVSVQMWEEQGKQAAKAMVSIWAAAFPAHQTMENLVGEADEFIRQANRMIQRNYHHAWQDMQGGNNFAIQLGHLQSRVNLAKAALAGRARVERQLGIAEQQELGL